MIEKTFVMLKPDAVQRAVMGEILARFEKAGLKVVAMKMVWIDRQFARIHYAAHLNKDFYPPLEEMIVEAPVLAMVIEGARAVSFVRKMSGPTKPEEAPPGTIRGDFAHFIGDIHAQNVIHSSGSVEEANKEISLWFKPEEIHSYRRTDERHFTGK